MAELVFSGDILKALFLGLVQGLTEFLPVSSSGHLRAFRDVLGFEGEGLVFDVSVHMATLLAVVIYFRNDLLSLARGPLLVPVCLRLFMATAPVLAAGALLAPYLDGLSAWVVVAGWVFSALYLFLTRGRGGETLYSRLSLRRALVVGLAQCVAILPGVSRSGSTIAAGLWVGLGRAEAARFSFLLSIPAVLAAGGYTTLKLLRSPEAGAGLGLALAVACPAAFVSGLLAIHILLRIVQSDVFHRFGVYNLLAAALFAAFLLHERWGYWALAPALCAVVALLASRFNRRATGDGSALPADPGRGPRAGAPSD
jgi:undecaprenyl-diphosphatase